MIEWFKHDIHCLQDDRLFALVSRYGADGYAVYFHTVEAMYAGNGEPLSDISVRRIAFDFGLPLEKVQGILDYASSEGCDYLLESTDAGYVSRRVMEECGRHTEKVSRMQSLAHRRWNAKSNAVRIPKRNAERNAECNADKTREDKNIPSSLTTFESMVGGQRVDAPTEDKGKTDLFGERMEQSEESVPYKSIGDYWNKVLDGKLPRIKSITDSRRILIKQRWHEYHNDIYGIIDKVAASDFLTGWKACGFDWCFKRDNMVKIAEGNYDNGKRNAGQTFKRDLTGRYDDVESEVIDI